MWKYNSDFNKWSSTDDKLTKSDFNYLKQELKSTRLYSKCLSGATYLPVNDLSNIYDIIEEYQFRNWYIPQIVGSAYSVSTIPPQDATPITNSSSYDFYNKSLSEYGLTLKNLFTPSRLIKDSLENYNYVDVSTTEPIDLSLITDPYYIDDVRLKEGHKVLVKDQITVVTLLNSIDPNTYFTGNYTTSQDFGATIEYQYFDESNGIYTYKNGKLIRDLILDDYQRCIRFSTNVKLGTSNAGKQFHLSRLLDGFYPTTSLTQPIEFKEKKNWILRNRVDYNNLFEINYYDVIKNGTQSYTFENITYTIPTRTISVGEFGVILNTQEGKSNIIKNKYKVNLRGISETSQYYWICGDSNTLLKVRKHDFEIERIKIEDIISIQPQIIKTNIYSVSFFNDLRGVIVGELNTILVTKNGGHTWTRIELDDFNSYNYNKVLFTTATSFFIAGNTGVLIEMVDTIDGWVAYKRRVSKKIDDDDEYILVDNINDIYKTTLTTWSASYSYSTYSIPTNKELLFLATNNGNIIAYDINNSFSDLGTDFIYFDFSKYYGDIRNITRRKDTDYFYFTGTDTITNQDGIFSFDINNFQYLGTGSSYSNTTVGLTAANFDYAIYPNEIFDYDGSELIICGNTSLLQSSTYSVLDFNILDPTFEEKLKSKLLVLDYDIASKLNFFTDAGDYRLPNSLTFSDASLVGSYLAFDPLIISATAPSFMTQSETNWITYWSDRQKTFQFYTNTPMDESVTVLMSTTFSYSSVSTSTTISSITGSASQISYLAPTITISNSVKSVSIKNAGTGYATSSNVSTTGGSGTGLKVDIKAPLGLITSVKIVDGGYGYNGGDVVIINGGVGGTIKIDSVKNSSQSRYDSQGLPYISTPTSAYDIYIYDYLMVYKVSTSYPVSIGDIIQFNSSVVDGQFMVNKIETLSGDNYIYMFTDFNGNITKELQTTTYSITLTNLNRYQTMDELTYRFNEHPIGNAYKLEYSDSYGNVLSSTSSIIKISADFNYLTSYYNLGTNVIIGGNYSEMKYTSGFLNFGYSPTYNLLSYLEGINGIGDLNPTFYATKEYLAMPEYRNIPLGSLTSTTAYIDSNGMTASYDLNKQGNKITFGKDLYLEWNSILLNTFVDVIIHGTTDYTTERLLVMDKYYDEANNAYVIDFHKRLNFTLYDPAILSGTLDIISRRHLSQISDDLQELNNIQRTKGKSNSWKDQGSFVYESYENELNFKIPTDSYAKVLLSDASTVSKLSAIIYVDYKNELAMNITRLAKEYSIPILNTSQTGPGSSIYNPGKLYISCSQKHELITGDGVNLEFTGATGSSQQLNQQYFGYHPVIKVTDYDFVVNIDYGTTPLLGNDIGYVKYTRQDPFLNYQPVDLIDYGVDKRGKQSIELTIENLKISGSVYSLIDIDYDKYRYRLIDGLNLEIITLSYPWILEAEISGAIIGINSGELIWYKGTWECGRWFGGTWHSGVWMGGDWYGGTWNSNIINDRILSVTVDTKTIDNERSIWYGGRWYTGTWNNGTWNNGRWYSGTWNNGVWYKGTWNDGTWNSGLFEGGIWVLGTWNTGIFNCNSDPAYWLDGEWNGGDFENGMWYDGTWQQKNGESRFGTKSFNSRTATWQGGYWLSGSFYSKLNTNDSGQLDVSDTHKYSIWKTGKWLSGEWYGGIAYNMDWKLGTWYGGILEDIQVVGIDTLNNTFTLNGIFKFNIGDDIYIVDNQVGGTYSTFGSNEEPGRYKVIFVEENGITLNHPYETTTIHVNYQLSGTSVNLVETNLRVVSRFTNLNWKSGIWTNGLFDSGLWEGGIWYNGVFSGTWM